jgi:hypothetical protein
MHRTVPIGLSALHVLACGGTAISREAGAVREAAIGVVDSVERSQWLFGEKASALAASALSFLKTASMASGRALLRR